MKTEDPSSRNQDAYNTRMARNIPLGAGIGLALGAGIGTALGNIAIGGGIGVGLGTAIGIMLALMKK